MARKNHQQPLRVVHDHCAGIDIGSREHWVGVDPDRCDNPVRRFSTFTDDLLGLADWLESLEINVVAMEATGVYWIPLFETSRCARLRRLPGQLTRDSPDNRPQVGRAGLPMDLATHELRPSAGCVSALGRHLLHAFDSASARQQGP